jgi:hypothetical protein
MDNEVFLLTINEDEEDVATEVFKFKDLETCNYKLNDLSWGNLDDDNIRIYHGVLSSATFLPESFKGCTPYIVIKNPEGDVTPVLAHEHVFKKVPSDPAIVAINIQTLLEDDELFISSTYLQQIQPTIYDVQIFFGRRVSPVFTILEENLDEEVMYRLGDLMNEFKIDKERMTEEINEN